MRIVLLGAPGSGKGTQSQKLAAKHGVPQVSSGDLLRDAVARRTQLGLQAKAAMDAGELVTDDLVLGLIRERLARPDARRGFVLDGYPRNIAQAEALERLLRELRQPIDAVILMDVDPAILMQRLTGRRTCARCGRVFNVYTSPPNVRTPCVGGDLEHDLVQRPDDNEDKIRNRLEVYAAQTRPLIDHYRARGLLREVNAEGDPESVFARFEAAAGAARPAPMRKSARRRTVKKRAKSARRPVVVRRSARRPARSSRARKTGRRATRKAGRAAISAGRRRASTRRSRKPRRK